MALDTSAILSAIESHAASTGRFERVNKHEPKNAPGNGLTCAIWVQNLGQAPRNSGLTSTSALVVFMVRIYSNMVQEPQDAIDENVIEAVDVLLDAYSGDFELGGNVRAIDLLGQAGQSLSAQAGYLEQDGKMFRVMDIIVPLIVNDVWTQGA